MDSPTILNSPTVVTIKQGGSIATQNQQFTTKPQEDGWPKSLLVFGRASMTVPATYDCQGLVT